MTRRAPAAPLAAYVLHRYDWSESSLIVELFTRERGRIVVAARGAKRPTSQLRPVLLPLQRLTLTLGRAPADDAAEVQTLRAAEWGGGAPMPGGGALFSGLYLNELLLKLLARHDAHPALFDAYEQTLPALRDGDAATGAAALRAFELVLLRETGVLPQLDRLTATQQLLRPGTGYALHAEAGVGIDGEGALIDGAALVAIEHALQQRRLAELQAACLAVLPALRMQLRALLHYHLGSSVLRSRRVMQDVQRLIDFRPAAP